MSKTNRKGSIEDITLAVVWFILGLLVGLLISGAVLDKQFFMRTTEERDAAIVQDYKAKVLEYEKQHKK